MKAMTLPQETIQMRILWMKRRMPQQHLMQKPAIVREEGSRSGGNHATRKLAQHTDQLPTEQQAALWQSDVWAGKEISRPARPLRQPLLKAARS